MPQPGNEHRELRPEDRRRVRPAPQPRQRLLLLPPPLVTPATSATWSPARHLDDSRNRGSHDAADRSAQHGSPDRPALRRWARRAFLIGQAVRERQLALGLSQVELAARAGMTQPALSRLEAGGVVPTIPLLERISMALDADLVVE
ncbi:MAG TPA: helix-turn-helix transcriptional regulator [Streptosporangiaceae bacterium]|nr:helix-turn-helix transcriptional regulator [Streptosporangiaceae bacterium]